LTKNFRVWPFLEQISRKKLRIQIKVRIRVKETFANGQNPSKNILHPLQYQRIGIS